MISFKDVFSTRSNRLASSAKLLILLVATSVTAFAATPTLDRISCVKSTYGTAGTDTCRAFLTGSTNTHLYIHLSSNNSAVQVPNIIMVSLNADSKGFVATIAAVTTKQTATITATFGGVSKSFAIPLSPPVSGVLSLNATSIGFGSTIVNTPIAQGLTLTSKGTTSVTVNSATVSGAGFSVSGTKFPMTLNPGQSVTLDVQFDPTTTGSYSGKLTISSSVSTQTVALTGTGAAHQVNLSWSAPGGSSSVAGYNVYRAAGGTTSYQRLNSSVESDTTYTDGTVQSGSKYSYVVKSVSSSGVESAPSNSSSVTVP